MIFVTIGPAINRIQFHFDYLRIIAVPKYPLLILFEFYTCIRDSICRVNYLLYFNWSKFEYLGTLRYINEVLHN
jgi:hypothetical protein